AAVDEAAVDEAAVDEADAGTGDEKSDAAHVEAVASAGLDADDPDSITSYMRRLYSQYQSTDVTEQEAPETDADQQAEVTAADAGTSDIAETEPSGPQDVGVD